MHKYCGSAEKFKTMKFLGQDPVGCKIVAVNKCLQQGKNFKYLGCEISYENGKDIQQKLAKFAQILGILQNTFKPTLVQKFSVIQVHNALSLPTLYMKAKFGPVEKIIKKKKSLTSIEMKFFRRIVGTPFFDHKRHEDILEQLKGETVHEKLRRYKSNWQRHIKRMNNNRMTKIILN